MSHPIFPHKTDLFLIAIGFLLIFPVNSHSDPGGTGDFLQTSPHWSFSATRRATDLGRGVASAGDVNGDGLADIIIGEHRYDGGQSNEGRVLLFLGTPVGPEPLPSWSYESDVEEALLGYAVSAAGDVNGDGFGDVLVGALGFSDGEVSEGKAFLFLGSIAGLEAQPAWTVDGNQEGAQLGKSVASAGDVNGDGFGDILIGAPFLSSPWLNKQGGALLFLGSSSGPGTLPAWTVYGGDFESRFGESVSGGGDVNGDGFDDVVVGAPDWGHPYVDAPGLARLYLGSPSGLEATPAWEMLGEGGLDHFGGTVSIAGDYNGDGFHDILIGARGHDSTIPQSNEGRAYLWLGSPTGPDIAPDWISDGGQVGEWSGTSVASAGDVNGDGFDDALIGSCCFTNGETKEGRAYLFLGSPTGPEAPFAWATEGNRAEGYYGSELGSAGDVNGDGFDDALVGAPYSSSAWPEDFGMAFVFLGSANGIIPYPTCDIQPSSLNLQAKGNSLSIATTLNNLWDGGFLDSAFLSPVYISRVSSPSLGDLLLPTPRAEPGCDPLSEDGIWETVADRTVGGSGTATLRFNTPSDGQCETMDGNRQDIIALMLDIPDGEVATLCYTGTHPDVPDPFECCGTVGVGNRGNR